MQVKTAWEGQDLPHTYLAYHELEKCFNKYPNYAGQEDCFKVHVLDPATLQLQATWQLPSTCTAAAVSPNGCLLASAHQTRPPGAARPVQTSSSDSHSHTDGPSQLQEAAVPPSEVGHDESSLDLPCTHVSFSILLPEAQKALVPKLDLSGQSIEDGKGAQEVDVVGPHFLCAVCQLSRCYVTACHSISTARYTVRFLVLS